MRNGRFRARSRHNGRGTTVAVVGVRFGRARRHSQLGVSLLDGYDSDFDVRRGFYGAVVRQSSNSGVGVSMV